MYSFCVFYVIIKYNVYVSFLPGNPSGRPAACGNIPLAKVKARAVFPDAFEPHIKMLRSSLKVTCWDVGAILGDGTRLSRIAGVDGGTSELTILFNFYLSDEKS